MQQENSILAALKCEKPVAEVSSAAERTEVMAYMRGCLLPEAPCPLPDFHQVTPHRLCNHRIANLVTETWSTTRNKALENCTLKFFFFSLFPPKQNLK